MTRNDLATLVPCDLCGSVSGARCTSLRDHSWGQEMKAAHRPRQELAEAKARDLLDRKDRREAKRVR